MRCRWVVPRGDGRGRKNIAVNGKEGKMMSDDRQSAHINDWGTQKKNCIRPRVAGNLKGFD